MKNRKRFSFFKLLLFLVIAFAIFYFVASMFYRPDTPTSGTTPSSTINSNTNSEEKDTYTGYYNAHGSSYYNNWQLSSNVGKLNSSVASGVRNKRTTIIGNNKDKITIMVFMCGSDLESQAAMGVSDLSEMNAANISDNINLIVYTGGTTKWHVDGISTRFNQIYQVKGGGNGILRLVENAGTGSMVDPDTLTSFIEWCADNFEANRYELILWDHGGGSVSGYGYDLKYPNSGSMDLAKIDQALTEADVAFDFIGFDACLMANTETALMLAEHADYLIASEESEPGIGWYYTDWLTALSRNTSMSTLEIGKNIADSFVRKCGSETPSQSATLSVVDLAEVQDILPAKLSAFAKSTTGMINNNGYKQIASARSGAREFAVQNYVDLVDLADLAGNVGTDEAKDLADALLSCVKYNNTSRNMSGSYGLSIYFPYRSGKYVSTVLNTYNKIDMNADYADCVRSFASYSTAGQVSSGGQHSPYQSISGYSSDNYYSSQDSSELIYDVLDLFLGGSYASENSYSSYYGDALDLLFGRGIDRNMTEYIAENHFSTDLNWKDGKIAISKDQWELVDDLKLNVLVDDGSGYIDLGKDSIYDIDADGNLLKNEDRMWLAASIDKENWQVIPYYYLYQTIDGDEVTFTGRIPVLLNGEYANLIVNIDNDGVAKVIGATFEYREGSGVVAKNLIKIGKDEEADKESDTIAFVCDYYNYDGSFEDTHILGDPITVTDQLYLGDVSISDYTLISSYELKDIYQQSYWTAPME